MELVSRELVLKKLAVAFPDGAIAKEALASLDQCESSPNMPVIAVQLAIIKLSNGSLAKLRDLVRQALHDFRDVLYPAQAPELFRRIHENPPSLCGEIPNFKPLTPAQERAMQARDQQQWIEWLTS